MSEFKRNIVSNFKRYTDGKNRVEYIVKLAMYSALAFVLYNIKFPLPAMFPYFLDIQISELPALIAGFSMGPISGCLVIIIKMFAEIPAFFNVFFVGEATDILLGICFVLPSSLIYNSRKNKKTALFGACRRLFGGNGYVDYRQPFYLDSVLCRGNVRGQLGTASRHGKRTLQQRRHERNLLQMVSGRRHSAVQYF
ncbi:MAG: ECF transporter S component [Clostridium sp.]|nr:MAG: ECF transporter S component [Clostridium sp.]